MLKKRTIRGTDLIVNPIMLATKVAQKKVDGTMVVDNSPTFYNKGV